MHVDRAILYFDGASRNNPRGPAGCGFRIVEMDCHGSDGDLIADGYDYLGYGWSNNEAEYKGFICGLQVIQDIDVDRLYIRGDSEILVKQMNGEYQVHSPNIRPLYNDAKDLLRGLNVYSYDIKHISRAKNYESDELANEAINTQSDDISWYNGYNPYYY